MKVKVGDLKTHLSSYLRKLREDGEPIEVCVREDTVAYLSPVATRGNKPVAEENRVRDSLERLGLKISQWGRKSSVAPVPGRPADGRTDRNSVVQMRSEKDR